MKQSCQNQFLNSDKSDSDLIGGKQRGSLSEIGCPHFDPESLKRLFVDRQLHADENIINHKVNHSPENQQPAKPRPRRAGKEREQGGKYLDRHLSEAVDC